MAGTLREKHSVLAGLGILKGAFLALGVLFWLVWQEIWKPAGMSAAWGEALTYGAAVVAIAMGSAFLYVSHRVEPSNPRRTRSSEPRPPSIPAIGGAPPPPTVTASLSRIERMGAQLRYVGRADQVQELGDQLRAAGPDAVRIAVSGMSGLGKTATVIHTLYCERAAFPDGMPMIDLEAHSPTGAPAALEVLRALVVIMGGPPDPPRVQHELEDLWHEVTRGKRLALFLDNASSPDQVRPLTLAHAGCATVVTSQNKLSLDAFRHMALRDLTEDESALLLQDWQGHAGGRVLKDADAEAIATLVGNLPIALCAARATLFHEQALSTAAYIGELQQHPLSALGRAHPSVPAALAVALAHLERVDAVLHQRWQALGVFDGSFDARAAEAVWGAADTLKHLNALVDRSLLEYDPSNERFKLAELYRIIAREAIRADAGRDGTLARLHAMEYLRRVREANIGFERLRPEESTAVVASLMLDRENIKAAQRWARQYDADDPDSEQLLCAATLPVHGCLEVVLDTSTRRKWLEGAVEAAQALGDSEAEMRAWRLLGSVQRRGRDPDAALASLQRALELCDTLPGQPERSKILINLGIAHRTSGNLPEAAGHLTEGLRLAERAKPDPDQQGIATACGNLGQLAEANGDLRGAAVLLRRALDINVDAGNRRGAATNEYLLGGVLSAMGKYDESAQLLESAAARQASYHDTAHVTQARRRLISVCLKAAAAAERASKTTGAVVWYERLAAENRALEDTPNEVRTHMKLAALHERGGRVAEAIRSLERVLELNAKLGDDERTQQAETRLARLRRMK